MAHRDESILISISVHTTKWSDNNNDSTHSLTHAQSETASTNKQIYHSLHLILHTIRFLRLNVWLSRICFIFRFVGRCQFIVVVVVVHSFCWLFFSLNSSLTRALWHQNVCVRACVIHLEHWIYVCKCRTLALMLVFYWHCQCPLVGSKEAGNYIYYTYLYTCTWELYIHMEEESENFFSCCAFLQFCWASNFLIITKWEYCFSFSKCMFAITSCWVICKIRCAFVLF